MSCKEIKIIVTSNMFVSLRCSHNDSNASSSFLEFVFDERKRLDALFTARLIELYCGKRQ